MQSFYDGMILVGSLVVLVLVLVLTYYASRWYAGRMGKTAAGAAGRFIKILDRVTVSPGCSIMVIQAGDKFYLIGTSDKNFQMLCELADFDPGSLQVPQDQMQFLQLFKGFLNKADNPPKDNGTEK